MVARRLVSRGTELCVAASTASAAADDDAVVGVREVVNYFAGFFVVHDRPDGNFQDDALAIAAGFLGAFAVPSALSTVFGIETEVDESVVALAGFHPDVASLATVATGRSAARDEFLPPEGHAAVTAVAGFDSDC